MVSYQIETYDEVINEIKPLLMAHWEEIALHKNIRKLNPDYDRYRAMEKMEGLQIATARAEGVLVGYSIDFIVPHPHYKDCIMALNDIIFLKPEFRRGMTAYKLIKFEKDALKKRGVVIHQISMKLKHDFGRLTERLGYSEVERIVEGVL